MCTRAQIILRHRARARARAHTHVFRRTDWKGKRHSDPSQTQMVHANVAGSAEFCTVTALAFLLRYYALNDIHEGPLFRKFVVQDGVKVPQQSKATKPLADGRYSKWYAEKIVKPKIDSDGFQVHNEEGEPQYHEARYKGCASLTEEEGRKQLMLFFKSAAKQARLEGDSLAARRLEAATPHTFRASELCILARAHTHTHIHVCVCMCVCVCR